MRVRALVFLFFPALFFVLGWALVPTRISYGAGSIRCGTAMRPDQELGQDCYVVADQRIRHSLAGTVILALAGIPILVNKRIRDSDRREIADSAAGVALVLLTVLGIFLLTFAYGLD